MKKYIIKALIYAVVLISVFASINIGIDPYNIFHYSSPKNNGVEPNKNYIKTEYILHNPEKFDSFVFGSSRAGFLDTTLFPEGKYYNMCSSEAVPGEHLHLLKVFLKHGIVPKNLYIMVDDISCFVDPALHNKMLYRIPYPSGGPLSRVKFYLRYCDLITTLQSLDVIRNYEDTDPDYTERFRESGSERLDKEPYEIEGAFDEGYWAGYYALRIPEVIEDIKEIKALCEENGTNLVFVTNPLYEKTYQRDIEAGYIDFLEALSEVTDFWNFSSFSDITADQGNYYEASHFTPKISAMMIDTVFRREFEEQGKSLSAEEEDNREELWSQGFGIHVTEVNREEFISFLRYQAKERGVAVYEGAE
ncbi:MAG: hypothetical protein IJ873_02600 [Lachnospiraceae bacterium]|nr:hypothetical protein [Lachnospiraceae bacterium]